MESRHDENTGNPECIGEFILRTHNQHGLVKIYVHVFSDGRHVQHRMILNDGTREMEGHTRLCSKFGKTLYRQSVAYKYDTMISIANAVSEMLVENGVKGEDIMR